MDADLPHDHGEQGRMRLRRDVLLLVVVQGAEERLLVQIVGVGDEGEEGVGRGGAVVYDELYGAPHRYRGKGVQLLQIA